MLAQMDLAGGARAFSYTGNRVVTAGVTDVSFLRPVFVGDIVRLYTDITRVGTTSITIAIVVWVNRGGKGPLEKVCEALYTFVSVDAQSRPQDIEKTVAKSRRSVS